MSNIQVYMLEYTLFSTRLQVEYFQYTITVSVTDIIFVCHFSQATILIKISNLLICFCSFDLYCLIL